MQADMNQESTFCRRTDPAYFLPWKQTLCTGH